MVASCKQIKSNIKKAYKISSLREIYSRLKDKNHIKSKLKRKTMNILNRIGCSIYGHKYINVYDDHKDGYIKRCVYCGKEENL